MRHNLHQRHVCDFPDINLIGMRIPKPSVSMVNSSIVDKVIVRFEGNSYKGVAGKMLDGQPDNLVDIEVIQSIHEATGAVIEDYRRSRA